MMRVPAVMAQCVCVLCLSVFATSLVCWLRRVCWQASGVFVRVHITVLLLTRTYLTGSRFSCCSVLAHGRGLLSVLLRTSLEQSVFGSRSCALAPYCPVALNGQGRLMSKVSSQPAPMSSCPPLSALPLQHSPGCTSLCPLAHGVGACLCVACLRWSHTSGSRVGICLHSLVPDSVAAVCWACACCIISVDAVDAAICCISNTLGA